VLNLVLFIILSTAVQTKKNFVVDILKCCLGDSAVESNLRQPDRTKSKPADDHLDNVSTAPETPLEESSRTAEVIHSGGLLVL
jgi:hypothetical protein